MSPVILPILMAAILPGIVVGNTAAQTKDLALENFEARVNVLDQFASRFEGRSMHPQCDPADSLAMRKNLTLLFDSDLLEVLPVDMLEEFIDSVSDSGAEFDIASPSLVAECKARFDRTVPGKAAPAIDIKLFMAYERDDEGHERWAIDGVSGLCRALGVATDEVVYVSPETHNVNFLELKSYLNLNRESVFGLRAEAAGIDELTMLLTLVRAGCLSFSIVPEVRYHYLGLPGWIFTLDYKNDKGFNTGWLISSLVKVDSDMSKQSYISNLYNPK